MNKFILLLVCAFLILAVYSVDAKKGGRGKGGRGKSKPANKPKPAFKPKPASRRRRPTPQNVEMYSWNVNLTSDNVLIPQKAMAILEKDALILKTFSRELRPLNMTSSLVFMNLSSDVMAIKVGGVRGPCFLTSTSLTNETVQSNLDAWNATDIEITNTVTYNATGAPMSREAARNISKENPGLRRFCSRGLMVDLEVLTGDVSLGADERMGKLLGYNTNISMVMPVRKNRSGKKPGKGKGKSGKRRPGPQKPKPKPKKPAGGKRRTGGKRKAGKRRS